MQEWCATCRAEANRKFSMAILGMVVAAVSFLALMFNSILFSAAVVVFVFGAFGLVLKTFGLIILKVRGECDYLSCKCECHGLIKK